MLFSSCKTFISALLDLVYPRVCAGCGKELLHNDSPLCSNCYHEIETLSPPLCSRCGAPCPDMRESEGTRCRYCPEGIFYFDRIRSLYSFKDERVKNMVYSLKFYFQTGLAPTLSKLLLHGFEKHYGHVEFDGLVPVPLHKSRLREREFNQATLLSQEISQKYSLPIREDLIFRIRKTLPQSKLYPHQRKQNLENAFIAPSSDSARGMRILLVDDVMTTGTTMNAVSAILKISGAKSVCGLTFARTIDLPQQKRKE